MHWSLQNKNTNFLNNNILCFVEMNLLIAFVITLMYLVIDFMLCVGLKHFIKKIICSANYISDRVGWNTNN